MGVLRVEDKWWVVDGVVGGRWWWTRALATDTTDQLSVSLSVHGREPCAPCQAPAICIM